MLLEKFSDGGSSKENYIIKHETRKWLGPKFLPWLFDK
jgi:hypothetical protein